MSEVFRMDQYTKVYVSLQNDPFQWLADPTNMPSVSDPVGKLFYASADALAQLTPADRERSRYYSHAYVCGAAITLAAFKDSSIDVSDIKAVLQAYPAMHSENSYNSSMKHAENEAKSGINFHPELKHHVNFIDRYFQERSFDPNCAKFSWLGIGTTAKRISDTFWEQRIAQSLDQKPSEINWDEELKQI